MLRACRQVLRPGGRMLFTTIEPAPGLTQRQRRRVARDGPSAALVRTSYTSLLASAGFVDVDGRDITDAYRSTQQAWLHAMRRRAVEIGAAMGTAALEQRLTDRTRALAAIDDGLLRRGRYIAIRPPAPRPLHRHPTSCEAIRP